jgi:hypothetical protein
VVAAVAAAISLTIFFTPSPINGSSSLGLGPTSYDICHQVRTSAEWRAQATYGISFGVDDVVLSSTSAQVTVTSVTMLNPTGGLTLKSLAFVPYGGIASGGPGQKGLVTTPSLLAGLALTLPAHLTRTHPIAGADLPETDTEWELGVIVGAPISSTRASASGFRITYWSGTAFGIFDTRDTVAVSRTPC